LLSISFIDKKFHDQRKGRRAYTPLSHIIRVSLDGFLNIYSNNQFFSDGGFKDGLHGVSLILPQHYKCSGAGRIDY